jgi:hypothetical protein
MPTHKDDLDAEIKGLLELSYSPDKAVRKVFGFNGSVVLRENPAIGFEILSQVSSRFNVPFRSVLVVGSAHTGYSYFKDRDFVPRESDLDLAIVDPALFQKYSELSFLATKGYTDLTGFQNLAQFRDYLFKGIFRPDLMPQCSHRRDWFEYFNRLSAKYVDLFRDINCGIYQSELFFESKQTSLVAEYKRLNT